MKIIKGFIALCIVVIIVFAALYIGMSKKQKIDKFITKSSVMVAYRNTHSSEAKALKNLQMTLTKSDKKYDKFYNSYAKFNKAEKYINSCFMVYEKDDTMNLTTPSVVIGVNTKFTPLVQIFGIPKYFDKGDNGYYTLKDAYQKDLIQKNRTNKYMVRVLQHNKILLKKYKGYFLVGFSKKVLTQYISEMDQKSYNTKLIEKFQEVQPQSQTFLIFDVKTFLANSPLQMLLGDDFDVTYLVAFANYNTASKDFSVNFQAHGTHSVFDLLSTESMKKRALLSYSGGKNSIYMANPDLSGLVESLGIQGITPDRIKGNDTYSNLLRSLFSVESESTNSFSQKPVRNLIKNEVLMGTNPANEPYLAFNLRSTKTTPVQIKAMINQYFPMLSGKKIQKIGSTVFVNVSPSDLKKPENMDFATAYSGNFLIKDMMVKTLLVAEKNKMTFKLTYNIDALKAFLAKEAQ